MKSKFILKCLVGTFCVGFSFLFNSCTESIDSSNFAIKTKMTVSDFISSDEEYSLAKDIFTKVSLGTSVKASSIMSVLSARGNYTVFLPTNTAVQKFLAKSEVSSIDELDADQLELIAKSCIIDTDNKHPFVTAEFPTKGFISVPNLSDRLLRCVLNKEGLYVINGESKIVIEDQELSNGVVHIVDNVIAPSNKTIDKLIFKADNMAIFSAMLERTTWADSLHLNLDLSYEDPERPLVVHYPHLHPFKNAQHRYLGYTVFAEVDSIYQQEWNIKPEKDEEGKLTNWDAIYPVIKQRCEEVYGTKDADNLTSPDNAINQFVAYHLLEGKMAYNRLVRHFNEYGYKNGDPRNPQTVNYPVNVWAYFTTMGKHRGLLKVTQVGDTGFERDNEHKIYVNRISTYANGPTDDYHETGVVDGFGGLLIEAENGKNDNNALNGYYYPINKILLYSDAFRNQLFNERIRMDMATMLPELMSNNVRGVEHTHFENGYFNNITRESASSVLLYLMTPGNIGWGCFQGDQFMVLGLYDFTLKLPPVPRDGTYEIRMGVNHNSLRGMAQVYFGDDPDRLLPAGLPYDMRPLFTKNSTTNPWYEDTEDWTINTENEKLLRNQGFKKGMQYCTIQNGRGDVPVRQNPNTNRKIFVTADLKADKVYYMRFKSALKKTDSQFFMDYFEYASTRVYNSPEGEDIW